MKTTGNLGLKKPDGTDIVDITDLNGNMDILDTAIKAVQDHAADTVKHITAAERSAWNAKASTAVATVNTAGLMAGADKSKLDSVAQGANNYVHPNHTGDVISSSDGVTAIAQGVIVNTDINPAAGIDASKIGTGVVSNVEFAALDRVTGNIQDQLDNRPQLNSNNTFTNNQKITSSSGSNPFPALSIEGTTFNAALQIKNTTQSTGKRYSLYSYNGGDFAIVNETDAYAVAQVDAASKVWMFPGGVKSPNVPNQTTADITYYVRTDGNDGNMGTADTPGGAFKTWAKAYSVLPKTINHTVNVYIGPGTYPETISLKGFGGEGALSVIGIAASRFVQRVEIVNCTIVTTIDGFTCTATTVEAVSIRSSTAAVVNQVISTVSASNQSGIVLNLATARLTACVISNKGRVVSAVNGGKAYAENFSGTGNTHGYVADLAGHISYAGTQATSTNGNYAGAGGIVNSEVLNPWGDNTLAIRPAMRAYIGTGHGLTGGAFTKLQFNATYYDYQSNFSVGLNRFTAKKSGLYLITGGVITDSSAPASASLVLSAWINGTRQLDIGSYSKSGVIGNIYTQGARTVYLSAGDYVEMYAYADAYMVTQGGVGVFNDFSVTQIA